MAELQLLLAKKETTYGTPVSLVAADAILCENVSWTPVNDSATPDFSTPGAGPLADVPYGARVNVSFDVPLQGKGAAGQAPNWGKIIKACGWGETISAGVSVTYAPLAIMRGCDSLTLSWQDDRKKHVIAGFRGRVGMALDANGRPMLKFAGIGLYAAPTDGSVLAQASADWTGWLDSLVVESGTTTFSLNSVSNLGIRQFSFDAADNVRWISVPGQQNVDLVGRRGWSGKASIQTPLIASLALEALAVSGARVPFSLVHGTVAGKIVTVAGGAQVKMPSYSRDRGDSIAQFDLKPVPSALNTDDELTIVCT